MLNRAGIGDELRQNGGFPTVDLNGLAASHRGKRKRTRKKEEGILKGRSGGRLGLWYERGSYGERARAVPEK
jgi:hypothetical protein